MTEPLTPAPTVEGLMSLATRLEDGADDQGRGVVEEAAATLRSLASEIKDHEKAYELLFAENARLTATQAPVEPLSDERIAKLVCEACRSTFPLSSYDFEDVIAIVRAVLAEAAVRAQAPREQIAIAIVEQADHDSLNANIRWLLNPLPVGAVLYEEWAAAQAPSAAAIQLTAERDNWKRWCEEVEGQALVWAVERWNDEVKNRPIINKNRRTLDDTWRQVIRHFGGDPGLLVGKSHDELRAASPTQGEQS
jgi:hypothetical protein